MDTFEDNLTTEAVDFNSSIVNSTTEEINNQLDVMEPNKVYELKKCGINKRQLELEDVKNLFKDDDEVRDYMTGIKDLYGTSDDEVDQETTLNSGKLMINEALPDVLSYQTIAIAGYTCPGNALTGGSRKVGKSSMTYEIVADVLLRRPNHNIIFVDVLNDYDAKKQAKIFNKHCKAANVKFRKNNALTRIKVLRVITNKEFHSVMSQLEAAIKQVPKTCLLVIDTLTFFHHDTYELNLTEHRITRKEFVNHYLKIFNTVAAQTGVTILFTIPEHVMGENEAYDLKKAAYHKKVLWEHIQKHIHGKGQKFSPSHKNSPVNVPIIKTDFKINHSTDYIEPNEIGADLSLLLSRVTPDRFKLVVYEGGKSESLKEDEDKFYYRIKDDGLEIRRPKDLN